MLLLACQNVLNKIVDKREKLISHIMVIMDFAHVQIEREL